MIKVTHTFALLNVINTIKNGCEIQNHPLEVASLNSK